METVCQFVALDISFPRTGATLAEISNVESRDVQMVISAVIVNKDYLAGISREVFESITGEPLHFEILTGKFGYQDVYSHGRSHRYVQKITPVLVLWIDTYVNIQRPCLCGTEHSIAIHGYHT